MWQLMPQRLQGWVRTGGRRHSLPPSFNGNSMPSIWSGFNNLFWKDDKTFYNSNVRLLLRPPDFVPGGLTPSLFPFLSFSLSLVFLLSASPDLDYTPKGHSGTFCYKLWNRHLSKLQQALPMYMFLSFTRRTCNFMLMLKCQ